MLPVATNEHRNEDAFRLRIWYVWMQHRIGEREHGGVERQRQSERNDSDRCKERGFGQGTSSGPEIVGESVHRQTTRDAAASQLEVILTSVTMCR